MGSETKTWMNRNERIVVMHVSIIFAVGVILTTYINKFAASVLSSHIEDFLFLSW